MIELKNDLLKIGIKKRGAELYSLHHIDTELEYIWQGDESIWPWHAPNLFPIVGGVIDNELLIDGRFYSLPRHGFARHADFVVLESSGSHAVFSLRYNEDTLQQYPYLFEYQIIYHLEHTRLRCMYKIINLDKKDIWFSVGGHPAFNIPFFSNEEYQDYFLSFENSETLITHHLSSAGHFTGETSDLHLDGGKLWLHQRLFDNDALVFKTIESKKISIGSKNHTKRIEIAFSDFNSLGVWAKPGAPFVCVEPWLGYADNQRNKVPIDKKEGMISLAPGHVFEASFSLTV
ncbi:aldose 1-epimerase family protein [Olivibacter sp. SDN3]|uniref:aldose 1-epimerase family protein n=1 Tax=Olivibacter sp. SDN3 TaxID=2764720 RepID=UPI0016519E2B|nr:aldose 1-epimerase family protein [Olivibacter sp. SDN3]QNL49542.1 aldose 1-epimerase family protein [Olivibacter sp. SDN3]